MRLYTATHINSQAGREPLHTQRHRKRERERQTLTRMYTQRKHYEGLRLVVVVVAASSARRTASSSRLRFARKAARKPVARWDTSPALAATSSTFRSCSDALPGRPPPRTACQSAAWQCAACVCSAQPTFLLHRLDVQVQAQGQLLERVAIGQLHRERERGRDVSHGWWGSAAALCAVRRMFPYVFLPF
jgi:hypothetical protein